MSRKITVDIVSDTVCPWCYVGKRRFEEALARRPPELDVYVGWRPFQLNPDMPAEGMDRKAYLAAKFGGDERAEHIYSAIREAGASTGLDFDFAAMPRQPNTLDSHRLIDRAGRAAEDSGGRPGLQDAVVERLFRACFMEGRDIGDRKPSPRSPPTPGWMRTRPAPIWKATRMQSASGRKTGWPGRWASRACPVSSSTGNTPCPAPRNRRCS